MMFMGVYGWSLTKVRFFGIIILIINLVSVRIPTLFWKQSYKNINFPHIFLAGRTNPPVLPGYSTVSSEITKNTPSFLLKFF